MRIVCMSEEWLINRGLTIIEHTELPNCIDVLDNIANELYAWINYPLFHHSRLAPNTLETTAVADNKIYTVNANFLFTWPKPRIIVSIIPDADDKTHINFYDENISLDLNSHRIQYTTLTNNTNYQYELNNQTSNYLYAKIKTYLYLHSSCLNQIKSRFALDLINDFAFNYSSHLSSYHNYNRGITLIFDHKH